MGDDMENVSMETGAGNMDFGNNPAPGEAGGPNNEAIAPDGGEGANMEVVVRALQDFVEALDRTNPAARAWLDDLQRGTLHPDPSFVDAVQEPA